MTRAGTPEEAMPDALTAADAAQLEQCLREDRVAVIPTDTVYGLACNPESPRAIARLYELKRRPLRKPSAVMFFNLTTALEALSELEPRTRAAVEALLPGPITLLLPNPQRRYPLACDPENSGMGALGVRVPLLEGRLAALSAVNAAAMQSSANLSGAPDPRRFDDMPLQLREGADLAIDGGELSGTASTVVDLSRYEDSGDWQVLRPGPITRATLEKRLA